VYIYNTIENEKIIIADQKALDRISRPGNAKATIQNVEDYGYMNAVNIKS